MARISTTDLTASRKYTLQDADGTLAFIDDVTGVPYTGATEDLDLGLFDLYTQEVWLYDGPNDNYGSLHYTDGNFHIEDGDGHPLFVIENGFLQLHLSATIQSNLILSNLTAIRDHYLPDESGTIALTTIVADSIANGITDKAPSQNAVFDALDLKQNDLKTFNRTQGIYYFEEFMGNYNANVNASVNSVSNVVGNGQGTTRSTTNITNKTNQQGVVESLTSANATGQAGFIYGGGFYKGNGSITIETYFNITTLSTLLERFYTIFGFMNGTNFGGASNAIFITYDEGGIVIPFATPTPNFRCVTRGGITTTSTITSVPVVAGQWYKLRINISNDGNTVTFFINDTLVATHTTNIPLNSTNLYPISVIVKGTGTTARAMQTDYFMYEEIFTNPR
jgi:hypothetical protein